MLQTLRRRLQGEREGGFTLIELMVVVLIIAILIAIAIPTFLGARTRAQNRAVQANLRNALTVEKSVYTDAQAYSSDVSSGGVLKTGEPSLNFQADGAMTAASVVPGDVYVSVASTGVLTLGSKSASGTCFYLRDIPTGTGAGTFYASNTTCGAPSGATVAGPAWT